MKTCGFCGGAIAEAGDRLGGFCGKWCTCMKTDTALHIGPIGTHKYGTPEDSTSLEEYMKKHLEKGNVKKPSFSHILNLCEQLSAEELSALAALINTMVKK